MDLKVRLKNFSVELEHPIMNAAGLVKKVEDVRKMAESATSAIVLGSITVFDRPGHQGHVYRTKNLWPHCSLNSLGIPNPGQAYCQEHLQEMVTIAHDHGKAFILNVAGFNPGEFAMLALLGIKKGVDITELNLGCPNIVDEDVQKPVISFDFDLVEEILAAVTTAIGVEHRVLVKVSPYSNPLDRKKVVQLLSKYPIVGGVTAVNTFPNAFGFDEDGQPLITPNNGFGGMGGDVMRPIGQAHVVEFSKLLPDLDVIGVGGISKGQHVQEYKWAGAKCVQIATAILGPEDICHLRPEIIGNILAEYVDVVEKQEAQGQQAQQQEAAG